MHKETMHQALEQYAPVLRFTPQEQFFPIAVEDFLNQKECRLIHNGFLFKRNVTKKWQARAEATGSKAEALGTFSGEQYFLQFTKETFGRGCLITYLVVLAGIVFLVRNFYGQNRAFIGLGIGIGLLALARLLRSNAGTSVFSALLLSVACGIPFWNVITRAVAGQLLFLLPAIVLFIFLMVFTASWVRSSPGLIMDLFSRATDDSARRAHLKTRDIDQYVCYGRITQNNEWTMLHYHYFYAFNDWRKAAEGINNHEGDWEAATVFLKGDEPKPYGIALSQHHDGVFLKWQDAHKVKDASGSDTYHPIIYVALGSHANYPTPSVTRAPELFKKGFVQSIIYGLDLFIRRFTNKGLATEIADGKGMRLQVAPLATEPDAAEAAFSPPDTYDKPHEEALLNQLKDTDLSILSDRMQAIVRGDDPELLKSQELIRKIIPSSAQAAIEKEVDLVENRLVDANMKLIVLEPLPKWIEFQGLWGVKSWLKDESGPPGPMWDRIEPGGQFPRLRWQWPVEWLEKLES